MNKFSKFFKETILRRAASAPTENPARNPAQRPAPAGQSGTSENLCPFDNLDDCPYWSGNDCQNRKSDCYHNSVEKKDTGWKQIWLKAVILVLFAVICIMVSDRWLNTSCPVVSMLLSGISISIIAGVIISFIIDLPKSLRKNEESILNALASDGYIKKLNNDRLRDLRSRITELLYKKDAPRLPKGLIKLDQKICELLMEPYYDRYNRRDIYKTIERDGKEYVEKTICISWQLVNPSIHTRSENITQDIELPTLDTDLIPELVQLRKVEIMIDDHPAQNIEREIKLYKDPNAEMANYNCRVRWSKSDTKFDPHTFSYRHRITAEICYVLILPVTDVWHGTRLRHAATSFHFNCSHDNPNLQIYGQVMGSLVANNDYSVNNITPNNIIIDVNTWLLPKNGIIIVFGPLANK